MHKEKKLEVVKNYWKEISSAHLSDKGDLSFG